MPVIDRTDASRFDGARLRATRKAAGVTGTELGAACGVAYSTITSWENGASEPRASHVRRLAQLLDVDIHDLFVADDSERP